MKEMISFGGIYKSYGRIIPLQAQRLLRKSESLRFIRQAGEKRFRPFYLPLRSELLMKAILLLSGDQEGVLMLPCPP